MLPGEIFFTFRLGIFGWEGGEGELGKKEDILDWGWCLILDPDDRKNPALSLILDICLRHQLTPNPTMVSEAIWFIFFYFQEENIDLEELEQFAKSFKRRRIELGMYTV